MNAEKIIHIIPLHLTLCHLKLEPETHETIPDIRPILTYFDHSTVYSTVLCSL